jgi:hypothetical protein
MVAGAAYGNLDAVAKAVFMTPRLFGRCCYR